MGRLCVGKMFLASQQGFKDTIDIFSGRTGSLDALQSGSSLAGVFIEATCQDNANVSFKPLLSDSRFLTLILTFF